LYYWSKTYLTNIIVYHYLLTDLIKIDDQNCVYVDIAMCEQSRVSETVNFNLNNWSSWSNTKFHIQRLHNVATQIVSFIVYRLL